MKLHTLALAAALVALSSTCASAQEFAIVESSKVRTRGPGARCDVWIALKGTGAVRGFVHTPAVTYRFSGTATADELLAVRRAYRAARVESLPLFIFTPGEHIGRMLLQSRLQDGTKVLVTGAELDRYGEFAGRLDPLLAALGAIGDRLLTEARGGFQQVTLAVRGHPTGDTVLNLQATGDARVLDRTTPGPQRRQGTATPEELRRVVAALDEADLDSIPDGLIADERAGTDPVALALVIVRLDGTLRTISARRDRYGEHQLAEVVAALDAIASRVRGGDPSSGVAGSTGGGLTEALGATGR